MCVCMCVLACHSALSSVTLSGGDFPQCQCCLRTHTAGGIQHDVAAEAEHVWRIIRGRDVYVLSASALVLAPVLAGRSVPSLEKLGRHRNKLLTTLHCRHPENFAPLKFASVVVQK